MQYKPGETCQKTGTYEMYDKQGKKINQVDLEKGESFPPTPNSGDYYMAK